MRPGFGREQRWPLLIAVVLAALLVPAPLAIAEPTAPLRPAYPYASPVGLDASPSAGGADTVVATWQSRGTAVRYQVRWVNGRTGEAVSRIVNVPATTIGGLWPNTRYYLRVRVVTASGKAASDWSPVVHTRTELPDDPDASRLRVATFNIHNLKTTGGVKSWKVRRKLVAQTIRGEHLDLVGLQEAEAKKTSSGVAQYRDVLNQLGPSWRATNATNTAGTRIIYNSDTLTVTQQGTARLSGSSNPKRFATWAIFTQLSSGRSFFFVNTHLIQEPGGAVKSSGTCSGSANKAYKIRKSQASQVVAVIRAHSRNLPVVLTGDMNSHKFACPNNGPYQVYRSAGLVDPIGNPDRSRSPVGASTELRIHTQYDTSNHYKSAPKSHGWVNGSNVDYVWVSKSVTTLVYETVVNLNAAGRFVGPPPSDHNMIRATVLIPAS